MKTKFASLYLSLVLIFLSTLAFCDESKVERINNLIKALSDKNVFIQKKSVEDLVKIGKDAVPQLINSLESNDRDTCANAVEALGLIGDVSAVTPILKILDKHTNIKGYEVLGDQYIRINSIKALGKLKAKEAVPVLEDIMQKKRIIDKAWCLTALYQIDPSDSRLESIFNMAKNDDPTVRNVIIRFISDLNDARVLPKLKEALSDKEWYVRDSAVQGIGKIGGKEQIDWLKPLLDDPVPIVAETAKISIEEIKK
jgi:HEAT repeat protein